MTTRIKPISETDNTVTLRRADFRALLDAAEHSADLAAVRRHRAYEDAIGWSVARRNYLTREEAERLLAGESPVRIWRRKRGMSQRALAAAAAVTPSYLAEIEGGKKPGSRAALSSVAKILDVPMENLVNDPTRALDTDLQPLTRAEKAADRLARLAERGGSVDRLASEARAVIAEWRETAEHEGVRHQLSAAFGSLRMLLVQRSTEWARCGTEQRRIKNAAEAVRVERISQALEAAIDAAKDELRRA